MQTHRFPQPLWNLSDRTIVFDTKMSDNLGKKECAPLDIVYVPNSIVYKVLTNEGRSPIWGEKAPFVEYPKALHGPDSQSVTVYSKDEEEIALQNGWKLKPIIEETPLELPPSPFRSPKPVAAPVKAKK